MASLHARHSRKCALGPVWSRPDADRCTCQPTYYTAVRDGKKVVRERVGRNRKNAERVRNKTEVAVDEGSWEPVKNIRFEAWAERWLSSLERKPTTIGGYKSTARYAVEAFGSKVVRRIDTDDVKALNAHLKVVRVRRPDGNGGFTLEPLSASTRAGHLRVLHACLASAVKNGYAARNPVGNLPEGERPRAAKKESAFFEDAELPGLVAELAHDGAYRTLVLTALKTGCRQGELVALTWGDVDLVGGVIRIRRTRTDGHTHEPKSHERRSVDLTADVVELLGAWWGELGSPADDRLVFPGGGSEGYLVNGTILDRLYAAMERAEIPRVGPTGEPRTFHSLRHTFARVALEHGAELTWLSRHLGHSTTAVTDEVYGHWSREARKRAMERLADAFTV